MTIEGCTKHPENNKTPIIREIDGDKLYFYEYIFTLDGEDGVTPYTETGTLSVRRTVPDLLYVCENENRLWGCDKTTIYASKLGDIFNWNVYDGLDTQTVTPWTPAAPAVSPPACPTWGTPSSSRKSTSTRSTVPSRPTLKSWAVQLWAWRRAAPAAWPWPGRSCSTSPAPASWRTPAGSRSLWGRPSAWNGTRTRRRAATA